MGSMLNSPRTLVISKSLAGALWFALLLQPRLITRVLLRRSTRWQLIMLRGLIVGAFAASTAISLTLMIGHIPRAAEDAAGVLAAALIVGGLGAWAFGPYTVEEKVIRQLHNHTFTASDGTTEWLKRRWIAPENDSIVHADHGCFLGSAQLTMNGHVVCEVLLTRNVPVRPHVHVQNTTAIVVATRGRVTTHAVDQIVSTMATHAPQPC
ncbi:hypothetical protein [Nocardia tengchongensis]|uniref:hypothetical protein n=1 Tax=Nocardia tengchongensis TaxID=2055889 RepID=UPI00365CD8E4